MKYRVALSEEALNDIKLFKEYIRLKFQYEEYAENFSDKMKKAIQSLEYFPEMHTKIGYTKNEAPVYYFPHKTYIIVYTVQKSIVYIIRVLKENMYWQSTLNRLLKMKL